LFIFRQGGAPGARGAGCVIVWQARKAKQESRDSGAGQDARRLHSPVPHRNRQPAWSPPGHPLFGRFRVPCDAEIASLDGLRKDRSDSKP
jgi:hypothetical protein